MPKMWKARTYDKGLSSGSGQDQRNVNRRRNVRRAFKRARFSLSNGKENLETKSVFCTNLYSTLLHEQPLDDFDKEYNDNNTEHLMLPVLLQEGKKKIRTNAMVDSGATQDFIDRNFCLRNQIPVWKKERPIKIYGADGKTSTSGRITNTAKTNMTIGSHQEESTFQMATKLKHAIILGLPWLKLHNPTIDYATGKFTFGSNKCANTFLATSPQVDTIPEEAAIKENLRTEILDPPEIMILRTNDEKVKIVRLSNRARMPTKGSKKAAGHDLYSIEEGTLKARGQALISTGISIGLPNNTYGRIAPRSGLALHYQVTTEVGVIDADYTGEIKVLLINQSEKDFQFKEGAKIAQLIIEKIDTTELEEVEELKSTERATKGFGSTDKKAADIAIISPKAFRKMSKGKQGGLVTMRVTETKATCAATTISTELALKNRVKEEKKDLKDHVPKEYHDFLPIFEEGERNDLPPHRMADHEIILEEGKTAPFKKLYPLNNEELGALREYLSKNLDRGWIKTSSSSAGAPILFVKKKDNGLRLCVDYRGLNAITKKDRYPLPLIGEAIDRLQTAKYFTKLDIKDAYHNIRIKEGDEWKTAFRTRYGLFEYTVMPFGLTNAPASFQRWINTILGEYLDVFYIVYLDDILIYSETKEQHVEDIRKILQKLKEARNKLKPTKCEFHKEKTEYLGFVISPQGIKMDPVKTEAIKEWERPKNVKDIQSFVGFCNFYRRFIEGFSRIAKPLYDLTKKEKKWEWTEKEEKAFEGLKPLLTTAPLLQHFDPD